MEDFLGQSLPMGNSQHKLLFSKDALGQEEESLEPETIAWDIVKQAGPNSLTYLLVIINEFTTLLFVSRTGTVTQTAAVGLSNMFQNCVVMSVGVGLCSGLDTCVSQACGAHQHALCAHYLQCCRSLVALYALLLMPVLWFSEDILLALHQDPDVASCAGHYNRAAILGPFFYLQFCSMRKFLQNQGFTVGLVFIAGACSVAHIGSCYIFISYLGLGNAGAGLANTITWFLQLITASVYLFWIAPDVRQSATAILGIQAKCFEVFGAYFRIASASVLQECAEWWAWELYALVVGYLGKVALAAHVSNVNVVFVVLALAEGLNQAAAASVGSALGDMKPQKAKLYSWVCMSINLVGWAFIGLSLVFFRDQIASAFTPDELVRTTLRRLLVLYAIAGFFDSGSLVMVGIIRGIGTPENSMKAYLFTFYGFMMPMSSVLAFWAGFGVEGIWSGIIAGQIVVATWLGVIVARTDWHEAAAKAAAEATCKPFHEHPIHDETLLLLPNPIIYGSLHSSQLGPKTPNP